MTNSEYYNLRAKVMRKDRRENHLCTLCGKQDAYTLNGRMNCRECNKKERIRHLKYKHPRGATGICWRCNRNPVKQGWKVCETCYSFCRDLRTQRKNKQ